MLIRSRQESYVTEGTVFKNLKRTTFFYRHERIHRVNRKEPVGAFVVATSQDLADGVVTAKRPLLIDWGATRGKRSWVTYLENEYGKTRVELTRLLRRKRIDAIVTIRRNKTYQIVLLNVPMTKDGVDVQKVRIQDARQKLSILGVKPPKPAEVSVDEGGNYYQRRRALQSALGWGHTPSGMGSGYTKYEIEDAAYEVVSDLLEDKFDNTKVKKKKKLAKKKKKLAALKVEAKALKEVLGRLSRADRTKRAVETILEQDIPDTEEKIRVLGLQLKLLDKFETKIKAYENAQGGEAGVDRMVSRVFNRKGIGRKYTARDILSIGGYDGLPSEGVYSATFEEEDEDTIRVRVKGTFIEEMVGDIAVDEDGKIFLSNSTFILEEGAPQGLATRMMYIQILKGQELGVDRMECVAAGSKNDDTYNGYYTWARLGYNTTMDELYYGYEWPGVLEELKEQGILAHIKEGTSADKVTMHDLMMTPEGRDFWKEEGTQWDATFGLAPTADGGPNRCVQVFENYVREKMKARGIPMHKWGSAPPTGVWEIPLTPQDEAILDTVWDGMLERLLLRTEA